MKKRFWQVYYTVWIALYVGIVVWAFACSRAHDPVSPPSEECEKVSVNIVSEFGELWFARICPGDTVFIDPLCEVISDTVFVTVVDTVFVELPCDDDDDDGIAN